MTSQDNMKIVLATCMKANPDKDWGVEDRTDGMWKDSCRLADVLLAIQQIPKTSKLVVDDHGVFWDFNTLANSTLQEKSFFWDLKNDDLSKQSPETLEFLANLLKHE